MDRNSYFYIIKITRYTSLSARRAWIEIVRIVFVLLANGVALRKESVDRNYAANAVDQILPGSLSARRAWIEIGVVYTDLNPSYVALRKESVDRNFIGPLIFNVQPRRSPQGERG